MQALAYCSYNMKTVQEGARLKMHAYFGCELSKTLLGIVFF